MEYIIEVVDDEFQYPSSRVILPDMAEFAEYDVPTEEFQYPSSRVILPDLPKDIIHRLADALIVSIPQ